MKTCILILGMHRSGTSALASVLHHMGYGMGKDILPPSHDNPRGFFENEKVVQFNDKVLEGWGVNWDTPFIPELGDTGLESSNLVREAKDIISDQFGREDHFIIKDPRLCYTFPIWYQALVDHHIYVSCIINLRKVTEIIGSLGSRNNFSKSKSFNLVCAYLLSAEYHTRSTSRHTVSYSDLLEKPKATIAEVVEKLDLPIKSLTDESYPFISRDLKNHHSADSRLPDELIPAQQKWIEALHLISSGSHNGLSKSSRDQLDMHRAHMKHAFKKIVEKNDNEKRFYKVLYKRNESFTEQEATKGIVTPGIQSIIIDDLKKQEALKSIKIILAHEPVSVIIEQVSIAYEDSSISYELSDNALKKDGSQLYFNDHFPQLIVSFDKAAIVDRLDIRLHYIAFGETAVSQLLEKTASPKSSPFSTALKSMINHPLRLIKGINRENIRVLRSALKRENPKTILRNFKKYLERDTQQGSSDILEIGKKAAPLNRINNQLNKRLPLHILYITPYLPEYDTSSGGRRSTTYLSLLAQEHRVHIFCLGTIKKKYYDHLNDKGIEIIVERNIGSILKALPFSHCIIYSRYFTYYEAKKVRQLYPSATHIIDSVDIHWVREERAMNSPESLGSKKVKKNKKREIEAYNESDAVWVVSEEDKKALQIASPGCSSEIVSNIHDIVVSQYQDPTNNQLLFIGGYSHHPNLAAVDLLATRIFPKVLDEVDDAKLIIAGSNAPEEVFSLGRLRNVDYIGFVAEEKLSELYAETLLSVVPLLSGAGVKGKITEAITYMTPVVTNDIGNEGINLRHLQSGLVTNDVEHMASLIIDACKGKYDLSVMAMNAQERLLQIAGAEKAISGAIASFYRPVDICIVTWNQLGLLKDCVESILKYTAHPAYQIIIYSNGCTDGTQAYLRDLEDDKALVQVILAKENEVFVRPNNKMMLLHLDRDVVLINNDVTVTGGWLKALYHTAYLSSAVGVAGAKILYPNGHLQEYGAEIYEDGTGRNIGKGSEDPYDSEYSEVTAVGYVSGCAMYIKRSTIEEIGVFDDQYHPCYCEDSDYCYTAWRNGKYTVVTPDSVIYHHEGSTSGKSVTSGFKEYQTINMSKLLAKHKKYMSAYRKERKRANKHIRGLLTS